MSKASAWRMGRRDFLQTSALAALALSGAARTATAEDRAATHNMLVFGDQTVFFSHLPMFDGLAAGGKEFASPHRFQVILQMALTPDQMASYTKDRQANPTTQFYTVGPQERFVLTRLFEPKAAPQLNQFNATIFRGHLEMENHPVSGLENVDIKIARVVHGRIFDPRGKKPTALEYVIFGRGLERFLAHAIFSPPDFDHVVKVTVGPGLSDQDLEQDVRVSIPDRKNVAGQRLREGQKVDGMLRVGSGAPTKVKLDVGKRIYFEEGELLVPPNFDPTAEEKKDRDA
jgi:hypothetical protein